MTTLMGLALSGLLAVSGPSQENPRHNGATTVLVMPANAVDGASSSDAHALTQLLASVLEERKDMKVTMFEPALYAARDPLVGVLARCSEQNCMVELGRRLGFQEVVGGVVEGQPGTLRLQRVSAQDNRVVASVEFALSEAELTRLAADPELMAQPLYPRPAGSVTAPVPQAERVSAVAGPGAPRQRTAVRATVASDVLLTQGLRVGGALALGMAVMLAVVGVALAGGYAWVVAYDGVNVERSGHHAFTQRMALTLDGLFGAGMLAVGITVPLGVAAVAALAASFLL